MERLKFKSKTTAGITYIEIDHENKTFCRDYYRVNGGWHSCNNVRLKDVRQAVENCKAMGYTEI